MSLTVNPSRMGNKRVIIIGGPTASGKTALAIHAARRLGCEIVSADSRQCYRELNIGVARPSPDELAAAPHHFIAEFSIEQKISAADFEQYALQLTTDLFQRYDDVVLVGGTGLYLRAFADGLDPIPVIPADLRHELQQAYDANGLPWLQSEVAAADPQFYAVGEIQNPHRLLRALEVIRATGRSIVSFRTRQKKERPFTIEKIAVDVPREELYRHINRRVDLMMEQGLEAEARGLWPRQHLNALQTVGYQELFAYFEGQCTRAEAIESIKTNTRHYAKRQLTWFRKDADYKWLSREAIIKRF